MKKLDIYYAYLLTPSNDSQPSLELQESKIREYLESQDKRIFKTFTEGVIESPCYENRIQLHLLFKETCGDKIILFNILDMFSNWEDGEPFIEKLEKTNSIALSATNDHNTSSHMNKAMLRINQTMMTFFPNSNTSLENRVAVLERKLASIPDPSLNLEDRITSIETLTSNLNL